MKKLTAYPTGISFAMFAIISSVIVSTANRSWQFNPYGWVDHWAYLGLEHFPLNTRSLFPANPAGDLLPVLLPSHLINLIFPLAASQYVRGMIFLTATTWLILMIVRKAYSNKIAVSIAALFIGSQYALTSLGSTYPSGSVILYLTLTIYLIQRKELANRSSKDFFFIVLSAMSIYFLSVYSAVLAIEYLPAVSAFLYFQHYRQIKFSFKRAIFLFAIALLCAFILVTGVLQVIYMTYGDGFFFTNNISKLLGFTVGNAYRAPAFSSWLPYASWLIIPCATVLAGITLILWSKIKKNLLLNDVDYAFLSLGIIVIIILIITNLFLHQWSLQFMYFTQTESIFFLALAPILKSFEKKNRNSFKYMPYTILLFSIFSLYLAEKRHYTFQELSNYINIFINSEHTHPLRLLVVITFLLTVTLFLGTLIRRFAFFSLILLMTINMYSFSPTFGCFACFNSVASTGAFPGIQSSSDNNQKTLKLADLLEEIDPLRKGKIWYNENTQLGPFYRQVNSVFYLNEGSRRVSKSFPLFSDSNAPIGSGGSGIVKNDLILLLSQKEKDFPVAVNALRDFGFRENLLKSDSFEMSDGVRIYIFLIRII